MTDRQRLIWLLLLVSVVCAASGGVAFAALYDAAVEEQRARLVDAVRVQARMIEAFARHEPQLEPGEAAAATLSLVRDAQQHSQGFGETGELVLARREAGMIVFLLDRRQGSFKEAEPVPFAGDLAAPMRRALNGESGSLVGKDYRGATVIAAYEPVSVLDLGLVVKIDLGEVRAPYIRAGSYAGLAALMAMFIIGGVFLRSNRSLLNRLELSEQTNRDIVETAGEGIFTTDEDDVILSFNPAAEMVFGYESEEVVGQNSSMLFAEATAPPKGDAGNPRIEGERKDGTAVKLEITRTLQAQTQRRGRPIYTCIVRDVTENERLEEQVRRAQKLEAVGRLAGGIAHDFNNLLMGVMGCSDIMLSKLEHDHPAREFAEEVKRTALSGASIAGQLLAFSRKRQDQPFVCHLGSVIAKDATMLRRLLGKDIVLDTTNAENDLWVGCDQGQLEQVIMNLIVNARDAMPTGGTITMTTDEVALKSADVAVLGELERGNYARLIVTDTGTGIDEEIRLQIFDPFFTTKDVGQGTGLGLSTAFGIINQHGGHIDVTSRLGEGTTFTIYLPIEEEPTYDESVELPAASLRGSETVLLVEDEPLVRRSVRHYLEKWNYQVLEAADCEEATQVGIEHDGRIHLLLTDTVLPHCSGREVAERVRKQRPDIAVIQMSAHAHEKLLADGRVAPGQKLLQKPFTAEALAAAIREVLAPATVVPSVTISSVPPAPRKQVSNAPTPEPLNAKVNGQRASILLVEDHAVSRNATQMLLRQEGFEVLSAEDGNTALALCDERSGPIDLLVTDMGLPDIKAAELVAAVKERKSPRAVLYISGRSRHDPEVAAALQDDNSEFLAKPIDFDQLNEVIERMLAS